MDLMTLVAKLVLDATEYGQGLQDAESQAKQSQDKMAKSMLGVTAAGAAAVTAFIGSSVKAGAEFDSAMSQVAATMGKTVGEVNESVGSTETQFGHFEGTLSDFAQYLGKQTAFSATEAAEAMNILAMAGYEDQQIFEVLPSVLSLAAAGGLSLAEAADYTTGIIAGFSNETLEATEIADKLAKVSSSAKGDVQSFGEGLSTVAGMATTTGQTMQDMTTALGILGNNNYSAAEAGNALSRTLKNLYQATDGAKKQMQELGVSAYDAQGNARPLQDVLADLNKALDGMTEEEKNNILGNIFDAATLKTVPALLNSVKGGMDGVSEALQNSGVEWEKYKDTAWYAANGANGVIDDLVYNIQDLGSTNEEMLEYLQSEYDMTAEDAQKAIDAVSYSIEGQGSAWDMLAGKIKKSGGAAAEMAETQLDNLNGDITKLSSAFNNLQIEIAKKFTPSIRGVVQFVTKAIDTFDKWAPIVGGLATAFATLSVALNFGSIVAGLSAKFQVFFSLLAANPIAVVIALVAGLIVATKDLWTQNEELMNALKNIWDQIQKIFQGAIDFIMDLWNTWGKDIMESSSSTFDSILSIITDIMELIGEVISSVLELIEAFWDEWGDTIMALVDVYFKNILNIIETVLGVIRGVIQTITALIRGDWDGVWNGLKSIAETILNGIKNYIQNTLNGAFTIVSNIMDKIHDAFKQKIEKARDAIKAAIDKIKSFFNFTWELPKLKLPHITVTGKFSLNPPSTPTFDIKWYKKAYDDILAFSSPTVIPTAAGFKGFGDGNGTEYVMGENRLLSLLQKAAGISGTGQTTVILELDKQVLGKVVYKLNNEETQRHGVKLVTV